MRHSQITDLIWCGGAFREGEWEALYRRRVRAVVSLQAEARDDFGNLPPDAELWLPAEDWHMPSLDQLFMATVFIDAAVRRYTSVVVHCKHGIGRAPMTVACYLITRGMGWREAIEHVRARRPIVDPNGGQVEVVREFEREVRRLNDE